MKIARTEGFGLNIEKSPKAQREMQDAGGRQPKAGEKRRRGITQGAVLMILSLVLVPAYFLLAPLFPPNDRFIESAPSDTPFEKISQAVLLTIFLIGLLRASYAWFFQKAKPAELAGSKSQGELAEGQGVPVSGFGAWRESEEKAVNRES